MVTKNYFAASPTTSGLYIVCNGIRFPYACYNGTIYPANDAPTGAFFITQNERDIMLSKISAGGVLMNYSNQRPYIRSTWAQPKMTSNVAGNGMTTSASSHNNLAYKPFSSSTASWYSDDSFSDWWKVIFPYTIYATKVEVRNREVFYYDNDWPTCGQWYKDSSYNYPIGGEMRAYNANQVFTIYNSSTPVELNQLVFRKYYPSGVYAGISQMKITAKYTSYEVPTRGNAISYSSYGSFARKV